MRVLIVMVMHVTVTVTVMMVPVLMAVFMIVVILAHIYIGSVGMEGAFAAMGSGQVDRNWAQEHHGLWVEEEDAKAGRRPGGAQATPAE